MRMRQHPRGSPWLPDQRPQDQRTGLGMQPRRHEGKHLMLTDAVEALAFLALLTIIGWKIS